MAEDRNAPSWYFRVSEDLINKRESDETRELVEEVRGEVRAGGSLKDLIKSVNARGTRGNASFVVMRAAQLEWESIFKAASEDVAAGRRDSPAVASARTLVQERFANEPEAAEFTSNLKGLGASDALVALMFADPAVRRRAREMSWVYLGVGALAFAGAIWFYTSRPPADLPYGSWVFFAVAVLCLVKGYRGLSRK